MDAEPGAPSKEIVNKIVTNFIESSIRGYSASHRSAEVVSQFGATLSSAIDQHLGKGNVSMDTLGATLAGIRTKVATDLLSPSGITNPKAGAGGGVDVSPAGGVSDFVKGATDVLKGAGAGAGFGGTWDFGGKGFQFSGSGGVTVTGPGGKDVGLGFDLEIGRGGSSWKPGVASGQSATGTPTVTTLDELLGLGRSADGKGSAGNESSKVDGGTEVPTLTMPEAEAEKDQCKEGDAAGDEAVDSEREPDDEPPPPDEESSSPGEEGTGDEHGSFAATKAAALREAGAVGARVVPAGGGMGDSGWGDNPQGNDAGGRDVQAPEKKLGASGSKSEARSERGNDLLIQPTPPPPGAKITDEDEATPTTNPK